MVKKIGLFGLGVGLIMIGLTFWSIYSGVKVTCVRAQEVYGGECVDSLMRVIESDEIPIKERNKAIWALGQLAEAKALPFLYQLNDNLGEIDRCKEGGLCKYEVEKAIKWCENGNVTSWMYKNNF